MTRREALYHAMRCNCMTACDDDDTIIVPDPRCVLLTGKILREDEEDKGKRGVNSFGDTPDV